MADLVLQNYSENITETDRAFWNLYDSAPQDPRVKDWLFMKDPYLLLGTIAVYLLAIYVILPKYMEKRTPFELKTFIRCYNIFQVVACALIAYGTITSAWTGWNSLGCKLIDFSDDAQSMQLLNMFWWNMVIKGFELTETIVFALRKKNNQISLLHVYHHVTTFMMGWLSVKFSGGGMLFATIVLNSCVHVLMYSYYFLASLGPEMQKRLSAVKSKLTIIQLTQLILLFLHTLQSCLPYCNMPATFPMIYLPVLATNITLFLNFYRKTYVNKKIQ